jgi:outer membrane protein assembly factor BamA
MEKNWKYLLIMALGIYIASCSPVKFVPEGSYLLNKVEVEVTDKKVNKEEVKSYIRQKENLRILGFLKFHLGLYNLSSRKKDNDWLKRIGEEPVIYNELLTQRSNSQLKQFFKNKGYYYAEVENQVDINSKKQKVNLTYRITPGQPYRIRNIHYTINEPPLRDLFFSDTTQRIVTRGDLFDVNILDRERTRIATLFRNHGYYDFGKEQIYYAVDTSLYAWQVDINMMVEAQDQPRRPYWVARTTFNLIPEYSISVDSSVSPGIQPDTLVSEDFVFISGGKYRYNPGFFTRLNSLKRGHIYREEDVKKTFNAFSELNQFRYVDIRFRKKESGNGDSLDCLINLAPMAKQSISFDVEGTNTSGNLGVAGNLNFQHRNLFRNAEIFRINLKGAMERQQWVENNVLNDFNTREAGVEASLTIPRLLGPGNWFRYFDRYLPQTVFTLGYNFQDRPDYTRTISNLKIGYSWRTTEKLRHTLNLVDFNQVNLYAFDPGFIDLIKDLYIKSSFTDHLISASNYTLVFNDQKLNQRTNYTYLKFSFESAGNLLNLLSWASGADQVVESDTVGMAVPGYYKILNTRYAQYVKADLEFRYGYMIDRYNSLVGRVFAGVGWPFGNFDVLPFEKKYFTGGANGIRAWQVRSLGPGTYKAPEEAYPNQSSDIKLEANLEYRFRLINILEGALFFDAGNIWAINDKDNREGVQFEPGQFYKQIAMGTGIGFRFDFTYFIFRLDMGLKLRDPSQKSGNGWIIGNRKLNNDDFNLTFAIGYPF